MNRTLLKRKLSLFLLAMLSQIAIFAQTDSNTEIGLDQKINQLFTPVANFFGSVILFNIPGTEIPFIVVLLGFSALYFTIYFGFINFRHFFTSIKIVSGKYDAIEGDHDALKAELNINNGDIAKTIKEEGHHGEVSHFQALATAVSGTVGLGNIAGVAIAIAIGGPGATFWMIVCGLLGMSTKFTECTLGVKYRDIGADGTVYGGPMYYLKKGLAEKGQASLGKWVSVLFALLCIGGSFGGGNAAQANQAVQQMVSLFGLQSVSGIGFMFGLGLAILIGIVIIGGIKRIASVTEKMVPLMAIIYLGACIAILILNYDKIGMAISQIMSGAFNPTAAVGGLAGVMVQGFRRAAFSNEAGAGSASIAHSAVKTKFAASEGLVSLLEPFIDTVVICTMTALVIVIFNSTGQFEYGSVVNQAVTIDGQSYGGVDLTSKAFSASISWFPIILTIAVVLFAVSTMISWSYYGLQAWKFLFGRSKAADLTYKILFLVMCVVGSASSMQSVFDFSDAMILGMVFPNMVGLYFLAGEVKKELNRYLDAIKASKL